MSHKQKTLWTKDFTSITIATILTAVGGEAMNLPISLLVFDETGSTFLSALVLICGVLPDVVLSVLAAPLIDKGGKKKWIVGLDILTAVLYAMMGLYISVHAFNYLLYLIFVLAVGTISVFYRLAYDAWYPNLIPNGMEQKGYAVSNTIYPLVIIAMSPAATFLYEKISMAHIFYLVSGITMVSVIVESRIHEEKEEGRPSTFGECLALLGKPFILLCFLGIMCHVGIDVGTNTTAPKILMERLGMSLADAGFATSLYFIFRTAGCFLGAFILQKLSARTFFGISVLCMLVAMVGLFVFHEMIMIYVCIALIGFGNSNIFPIIFSQALLAMPQKKNEVSGLMIMGLFGGTIFPLAMGVASDAIGQSGAVAVMTVGVLYLFFYMMKIKH